MTQKTKRNIAGVTAFLSFFALTGTVGALTNFSIGLLHGIIQAAVLLAVFIVTAAYAGAFTDNN